MEFITYALIFSFGLIFGSLFDAFAEKSTIRRLLNEVERLKLENQALMDGKTEVIEIVDNRQPKDIQFGGF